MAAISAGFLPRLASPASFSPSRLTNFYTRFFAPRLVLPSLAVALPGVSLNIPGFLGDIWEGILKAVPKKKLSHSRRRHKQMAGKALKDVNNLCKCPGCGQPKRTHRLCSDCLGEMRGMWKEDTPSVTSP